MAEKMKKGPSEAGRKTLKCPHKQGINLNMREQKGNPRLTLLVGCLAIVILAGCVAKFGVIDQYRWMRRRPPTPPFTRSIPRCRSC